MSDATQLEGDDLREFAKDSLDRHTPAKQEGNGYERCALCHYTRHPCDVYDLAAAVLRLLDERPARDLDGEIIVTKTGRVMTEGEIAALADEAEAGYDVSGLTTVVVQHEDCQFRWETSVVGHTHKCVRRTHGDDDGQHICACGHRQRSIRTRRQS